MAKQAVARQQYDQVRTNADGPRSIGPCGRGGRGKCQGSAELLFYPFSHRRPNREYPRQRGNIVKANDIELLTINQIKPIYVAFSVPEQNLAEIKKYMDSGGCSRSRHSFQMMQGAPSSGVLTFIDNTIDKTTGTILLKGTFCQ